MALRQKPGLERRDIMSSGAARGALLLIETTNGHSQRLLEGVLQYGRGTGHWTVCLGEQERGRQASE
ncbi:MAG: hypothetical protein EBS81_09660 [Gammaproteobacteria bacterium]|jgi:hypothetical protein|nr:hypothetical protein [Gammaproteobacteria bacterium]